MHRGFKPARTCPLEAVQELERVVEPRPEHRISGIVGGAVGVVPKRLKAVEPGTPRQAKGFSSGFLGSLV